MGPGVTVVGVVPRRGRGVSVRGEKILCLEPAVRAGHGEIGGGDAPTTTLLDSGTIIRGLVTGVPKSMSESSS